MKNKNKIYAMLIIGLFLIGMGADIGYAKIAKPEVNKTATVEKAKNKKQSVAKAENKDTNEAIKAEDKSEPNEKATPATKSKMKNKEGKKATSKTSKTSSKANNKKSGTKTGSSSNNSNSSSQSKPKTCSHNWQAYGHNEEYLDHYEYFINYRDEYRWVEREDGSSYSTTVAVPYEDKAPIYKTRFVADGYYCTVCGAEK